jgi:hypothetical protein
MADGRRVGIDYATARRLLTYLDATRLGPWDERTWTDALFAQIARQLPADEWPSTPAGLRARLRAVNGAAPEPEDSVLAVVPARR